MFFYHFHCVSIHLIYWFVRLARELELAYKPVRYLVLLIVHEKSVLVSLIVNKNQADTERLRARHATITTEALALAAQV